MKCARTRLLIACLAIAGALYAPQTALAGVFDSSMVSPPFSTMASQPQTTHIPLVGAASQHFVVSGSVFGLSKLYVGPGSGTFQIGVPASGSNHGTVNAVDFEAGPGSGLTGAAFYDEAAPFQSKTYSYSAALTGSVDGPRYTAERPQNNTQRNGVTLIRDATAPTGLAVSTPGTGGSIRNGQALTATASDTGSNMKQVAYQWCPATSQCTWGDGTATSIGSASSGSFPVVWSSQPADGTYKITARATDNVGNASTATRSVVVDNTAPGSAGVTTPAGSGGAVRNGQSIGSSPTDSGSGVASVTYRYCTSSPCAWPSATALGSTQTASPWSVAWSSQPADGTYPVLAQVIDNVGNATTQTTSIRVDNTVPSAFSISTPVANAIRNGQGLTSNPTDAGSGLASVAYQWCPASSACGWGDAGATTIGSAGSGTAAVNWTSQPADGSYKLTARAIDKVGNPRTSTRTITVDNTAPGGLAVQAPASGFLRAGQSLGASASDAGSGIGSVEFRYCAGLGSCAFTSATPIGSTTSSPYKVAWGSQPADGDYTVVARAVDRVGNGSTANHATTIDNTAPDGGSVTYANDTITAGPVTVATDPGADAGSGVAATALERDEAPYDGATCGTFAGAWSSATSPDSTTRAGHCYRYRYRVTDAAGNVRTYTSSSRVRHLGTSSQTGSSTSTAGTATPRPGKPARRPKRTTPQPGAAVPPPTPPPAAKAARVALRLLRRTIVLAKRNTTPVRLRCTLQTGSCRARLTIYARVKVKRPKGKAASIAAKRRATKKVILGRGRANIPAGETGTVTVRISRHARRKLLRGKQRKRGRRCRISINMGGQKVDRAIKVKVRSGKPNRR